MRFTTIAFALCITSASTGEPPAAPLSNPLSIREVTTFKDGHALVLRSGTPATDAAGDVQLSELPRAVLGTFWAHSDSPDTQLRSVRVEHVPVTRERTAATIADLIRANIGRTIRYSTATRGGAEDSLRSGTILGVTVGELVEADTALSSPTRRPPAVEPAQMVSLREGELVASVPINDIVDLRFVGEPPATVLGETIDGERMTLDLERGTNRAPLATAPISIMYLQRGLRWIPSYRITMLGNDRVRVELQATLINELADLNDVVLHLAIGVPSFAFAHTPDPIALRESLDQLGLFFRQSGDRTAGMLSNAIMGQSSRMGERQGGGEGVGDGAGELGVDDRAQQVEDLFVMTVPHVTLAKGARMVLPVTSFETSATSIYRLDLPAVPMGSISSHLSNDQHRAIAESLEHPTVRHVLRIRNDDPKGYPMTTAPALVVKNNHVLAQGLLTYASSGATVDLDVGTAVDIAVRSEETETSREPNALTWENLKLQRVSVRGAAIITNRKDTIVRLEVRRIAFGTPISVGQGGTSTALSVFAADAGWPGSDVPWWRHFDWPYYWHRLNGAARFTWAVDLAPNEPVTLEASWQYVSN